MPATSILRPAAALALLLASLARPACGELPSEAIRLRNVGIAQLENEQPAAAEKTFETLAGLAPDDPLAKADLAVAQLRQQKTDAAIASIDGALGKAPGRPDLVAIKAEILGWKGDGKEALALYRQAAEGAPDDLRIVYGLYRQATSLSGPEAESAAKQALERLAVLRPENAVVLSKLGQGAIASGDRTAATGAYLRLQELIWQAPPAAAESLEKLLAALDEGDVPAARVPALRLENLMKVTPMYQQGLRELSQGIQGVPVVRFVGEPPPGSFGEGLAVRFRSTRLDAAPTPWRALAVADFDGDRRPDVVRVARGADGEPPHLEIRLAAGGVRHLGKEAGDATGIESLRAADLDNDGHLDIIGWGPDRVAVWRGKGDGGFEDATARFGLGKSGGTAAAVLDYDIEGDLDLALFGGRSGAGEIYLNDLEGPLRPVGAETLPKLPPKEQPAAARGVVASDLDRDGDPDLLVETGRGLVWLDNLRQGTFRDRTAAAGLALAHGAEAVTTADLDDDGFPDVVTAGHGLTFWHNRQGKLFKWNVHCDLPPHTELSDVVAFDADNDGRLDLAVTGDGGTFVCARRRGLTFETLPIEPAGKGEETGAAPGAASVLAAADLDGDGDLDLLVGGPGGLFRLENLGGNKNHWLDVSLRGLAKGNSKNNLFGYGSTLEVEAGTAFQLREVANDVTHFGLGQLARPDLLRVVWTNGVPQDRLQPDTDQLVVEEQLLKGSCPFLYAWDGDRMRFVTDLLWGAPIGLPVAPGVWAGADPRELVRVDGTVPDDRGRYRMVVTEELWEAAFFDQVRLWVVDHPADVEVASSLRIVPGQRVPERVLGSRRLRPVAAAWDGRGRDVTREVARRDEIYADGYEKSRYQGVAARPWTFTFDLGEAPGRPVRLLLDGWIFPADASLNLAVAQRDDLAPLPPRLEVEVGGRWQTLMASMGHPAGKTKTMVVDTPALPPGAHRLRIVTSLWLSWDRIAWTLDPADDAPVVRARLDPVTADLHYRGFSRMVRRAPNAPHSFDYAQVTRESPWLPFAGPYTRYGDVRELLTAADDRSVILGSGDAMEITFDASRLPPPPRGWQRTVFLESDGWDKDADRNTYRAEGVLPLPFHAMSGYPYGPGEAFPDTPAMRRYRQRWLTRESPETRPLPERKIP